MNLSNVSRTAIFTLIMRDIMVKKKIISDPKAEFCLEKIIQLAAEEDNNQINKMKKSLKGIGYYDSVIPHSKRVKNLDSIANKYILNNTGCTIINLACGFDTRFWRINNKNCRYIEIDLPEVVELKKEIFKESLTYEIIGCSALDYKWIDMVTASGNKNFLIILEGLLMYLSEKDGIGLLQTISKRFLHSQLIFDMFPKFMTKGWWKTLTNWISKKTFGFKISMDFGFNKPTDLENISSGFKIINTGKLDSRSLIYASINE